MIDFNKRLLTSFGVSLGTGFMLESIFQPITDRYDPERPIPNKVIVDVYKYHFYSIITLVRNLITSFPEVIPHEVVLKDKNLYTALIEEMVMINSLYYNTNCKPVFYLPDHEKLVKHFHKGKMRDYTAPVKRGLDIYNAIKKFKFKEEKSLSFLLDFMKFPKVNEKALITTSYSPDLLNKNEFLLLNSHTGELIIPRDFYRLYNKIGTRDMTVFPFREILIYFIGDHNTSCIIDTKSRLLLYETAVDLKWNFKTTEEHIRDVLSKSNTMYTYLKTYKRILN